MNKIARFLRSSLAVGLLSIPAVSAFGGQRVQTVALNDSVLPVLKQSRVTGAPSSATVLHLSIGLQPRFPAELQAFCDSVSDPSSPSYRHFMTPAQVGENFGASSTDVNNVVSYLKSQGMKIRLVSPNRMAILADCTVSQAQTAFGTQIKNFQGPDPSGATIAFQANTTSVTLPASIATVVLNVGGLADYARPYPATTLTPALARALYNTAPSYGATPPIQGQGQRVAYSNWVNFKLSDANVFISDYSLPVPAGGAGSNIHVVVVGSGHSTTQASGEGNLDMQMELAAAPLADIYIYDNATNDLLGILTQEASDNTADIISESYGWNGFDAPTETSVHNQHLSMTAQGQTYLCASGDSGTSWVTAHPYPDVDPEVLTVGGTEATVDTVTGARISEVAWSGSGGGWDPASFGTTNFNVLPSWQVGNGVPTSVPYRLVPDIAAQADGSGNAFFFVENGSVSTVSGTSCSSPFCAACLTTVEQRLAPLGLSAGTRPGRLGRVADLIYAMNGRSDVWYDITTGSSNGTLPDSTASNPGMGWDFVTGWGAPNFDALYNVLAIRPVSGTVTLQNYPPGPNGISVTVQLYNAGTSTLVDTQIATLDAGGHFTVSSSAPSGNYDIYVKASHWLRRKVTNQSFGLTGVSGLTYSLINGDINGDNTISLADFGKLKAAYGSMPGDGNWNPNADLDGNGSVGLSDFGILKLHYGTSGD